MTSEDAADESTTKLCSAEGPEFTAVASDPSDLAAPIVASASEDSAVAGGEPAKQEERSPSSKGKASLQELMRRRREGCKEYESKPEGSKADAVAACDVVVGESMGPTPPRSPTTTVFESVGGGSVADASAEPVGSSFVGSNAGSGKATSSGHVLHEGRSFGKAKHTTNNELQSWMERMRDRCEVVESTPEPSMVDSPADRQTEEQKPALPTPEVVFSPPPRLLEHNEESVKRHRRSGDELNEWMSRMRNRCEILESEPAATTADAKNEEAEVAKNTELVFTKEVTAAPAAPKQVYIKQQSSTSSSSRAPAAPAAAESPAPVSDFLEAEMASVHECLRSGQSLSHSLRMRLWTARLGIADDSSAPKQTELQVPTGLLSALGGDTSNEDVLFDAGGDTPSEPARLKLGMAFCEKYLAWDPQSGAADSTPQNFNSFWCAIAQLLRYHSPAAACRMESVGVPHSLDLATVLGSACAEGGESRLRELIFAVEGETDGTALLQLCDAVVVEEEDLLLLFLVVARVQKIALEQSSSLEMLQEELRGSMKLGGLGKTSGAVRECLADALAMLEATPVTLISLLAGGHTDTQMSLPMCAIAPDELLHHIYEKPLRSWRFVVVDARMTASEWVLPVCIRLGATPHKQRRQVLREMPYQESIHLCIMSDGVPMSGDDAFELCRHLLSSVVQRKHVSVLDGGWPALEALARSLKLDLMRAETEVSSKPKINSTALKKELKLVKEELKQDFKQAKAAVVEVAGQISHATETATVAGQKVAQRMWAGAGRALQMIGSDPIFSTPHKSAEDGKRPPTNSSQ